MISSIFGKTKPINYIILLGFLFVFYWSIHFLVFDSVYQPEKLVLRMGVLALLLLSVFIVNFIVKRNKITGTNSFAILFYTLLIVVFPEVLMDSNAILCNFFLLLSIRRLLSIKSLKNIKLKIFDATLWIAAASFFYDWALLYLILVFVSIYFYEPKNIRSWMVPIVGIFTAFMIATSLLILADDIAFFENHFVFSYDYKENYFMDWRNSVKLILYALVVSLAGILGFVRLGKSGIGRIVTMRFIAISFIIGLAVTLLTSSSTNFPVLITFFPAVIFTTNYVEVIKKPNVKEIVLIATILIPFIILTVEGLT